MRSCIGLSLVAGLGIAVALVAWQGFETVASILVTAGWGLSWLGVYYLVPLGLAAWSWRWLFRAEHAPPITALARAGWVGVSVNWLLPVAHIGGEIVKARLLIQREIPIARAAATVVVDKTLQAGTQLVYGLIGLAALALVAGGQDFMVAIAAVAALFAAGIFAFYRMQRAGLFGFLARAARRLRQGSDMLLLAGGAKAFDEAIEAIYRRGARLAVAIALRFLYRLAMAGEIWLALHLMGHPASLLEAIILESVGHSIRSSAFPVPGGVGVQEGGFVLVGVALGMPADVSLALSLARRFRELLIGVPGLLAWQLAEVRTLGPASRAATASGLPDREHPEG